MPCAQNQPSGKHPSLGLYLAGGHVTGRNVRVIGFIRLWKSKKLTAVMASIGAQASFHGKAGLGEKTR
jgi:hypothetical protein